MESLSSKASIYDLFAYLTPAIVFNSLGIIYLIMQYPTIINNLMSILSNYNGGFLPSIIVAIFIILIAYIEGMFISLISWIIVYKLFPCLSKTMKKIILYGDKSIEKIYPNFREEFEIKTGYKWSRADDPLLITYVQYKANNAYNTAFVFLTLYGVYRSLFAVFGIWAFIFFYIGSWTICILILIFSLLSFYGFLKFHTYYHCQLIAALLTIKN